MKYIGSFNEVFLLAVSLTLYRFYTLFWCFYCCLQQVNARWDFTFLKKFVNKIPTYLWLALVLLLYLRLFLYKKSFIFVLKVFLMIMPGGNKKFTHT